MKRRLTILLWMTGMLALPEAGLARVFTDESGRQVEAEIVNVRDGEVFLEKNGRVATWPIEKLSASDQEYIENWLKKAPVRKLTVQLWERDGESNGTGAQPNARPLIPASRPSGAGIETKDTHKHYEVDVLNRSGRDANDLRLEYTLYVVNADGRLEQETGRIPIATIAAGERKTVKTKSITYSLTKKTTITRTTIQYTDGSSKSFSSKDISRKRDTFGGIWLKLFSAGEVVDEVKDIEPEARRIIPGLGD